MANKMGSDRAVQCGLEFDMKLATSTTAFLLLLALVAALAFFFRGRKLRLPPGPFPFPIIGNLHMLAGEPPHRVLAELSLKYGPLMSLRLGSALTLVVSSPEMAKEFLKTHDIVFAGRPQTTATKYLWYNSSDVVFSSYGRYWKLMRKFCVSQLLSSRRIDSFRLIRDQEVSAMIRAINSDGGGYLPVNLSKIVSAFGIDVICRMTFGKKYSDRDLTAGTKINSMIKETFILAGSFNIGDYIPYLGWMDLQGLDRRLKNIHRIQDDLLDKIVEEHASPQKNPNVMPDLVDVLLAASADEDMGQFQITRDNIKSVLYV